MYLELQDVAGGPFQMLRSATFHSVVIGAYCVDTSKLGGTKCLSLYCKPYAILYVCLLYLHRLFVKYEPLTAYFQRTLHPVTLSLLFIL